MSNRDDFTDDSSKSLGLTHGGRASKIDDRATRVATFGGGLQRFDLESRASIAKAKREDREKRVKTLMKKFNWTKSQAEEFDDTEQKAPERKRGGGLSREEREDRRIKRTEDLMKAPVTAHGSGLKSRAKQAKTAKFFCDECKLEFCLHRPKRGRPKSTKVKRVRARTTLRTWAILEEAKISADDALEIVANALSTGTSYATALAAWKAKKAAA